MSDLVWQYMTAMVQLVLPFLTIKTIFDYMRIFLFGKE